LIKRIKNLCDKLADNGWKELFDEFDLNIKADTPEKLKEQLEKKIKVPVNMGDIKFQGFEDMATEETRGITQGDPAKSLLFHALASPNVVPKKDGPELSYYPTLAEIELVENYVYGIDPQSLAQLEAKFNTNKFAIVVFASEYRPGRDTVHKKHADMCFSRTGIARVGTDDVEYEKKIRGFLPFVKGNDNTIRVLPSRFSAYLAIKKKGDDEVFGPMRFRSSQTSSDDGLGQIPPDNRLDFWVPIHKLFNGDECIQNETLVVDLNPHHVNEKLKRIHIELKDITENTNNDIDKKPYIFTDGIAELSSDPDDCSGLLIPKKHNKLIELALNSDDSTPLKFPLPRWKDLPLDKKDKFSFFSSSLSFTNHAPEYAHVRHEIKPNAQSNDDHIDLNDLDDVIDRVKTGDYDANHYLDFTGDGWIDVKCDKLSDKYPILSAYSLVAPPDFFPNTDQRELMDWTEKLAETDNDLSRMLWVIPPQTLSDDRLPVNIQLKNNNLDVFKENDITMTAIVSLPYNRTEQTQIESDSDTTRHTYLPDAAAGVFAPGWDVGADIIRDENGRRIKHLAEYRLGSPFTEDAKLCAALSNFWAAVAPDVARTFEPNATDRPWPTIFPLTDEEIGIGQNNNLSWDGIKGPRRIDDEVEYVKFAYGDYTNNALQNLFSLSLTGRIDTEDYQNRVEALAKVYRKLKSKSRIKKAEWAVLSFSKPSLDNDELKQAEDHFIETLKGTVYMFKLYRHGGEGSPTVRNKVRIKMNDIKNIHGNKTITVLANMPPEKTGDPERIWFKEEAEGQWKEDF